MTDVQKEITHDRLSEVIARLLPLTWSGTPEGYYRGGIRCCNARGPRWTCTLLPDHKGPHCATDANNSENTWISE